jgi:hypothetical protein
MAAKVTEGIVNEGEPKQESVKIFLVSIGLVGVEDGKEVWQGFHLMTAAEASAGVFETDDPERKVLAYAKPTHFRPGAIIEVEAKRPDGSSIFSGTARWVGLYDDKAQVTEWAARSEAWKALQDGKKAVAREKARSPLREALEPVRAAYRALPNVQRAQLIAKVVQIIAG